MRRSEGWSAAQTVVGEVHAFKKYLTESVLVVAILLVFGITSLFNQAYIDNFYYNVTRLILQNAAILGIVALGAAVVIISGGIDLSSGSMMALSGSVVCLTMLFLARKLAPEAADATASIPVWAIAVAVAMALAVSLLVGTLHCWLITVVQLPPFVATLASLVGLRSLALIMNKAVTAELGNQSIKVNIQDPKFFAIGDKWWVPVLVFLFLALVLHGILKHTVLGRHLYALGGNEQAARISGIRTERLKWFAYCFAAFTASVAGVLLASRIQQSDPASQGLSMELYAIAAAVIGGCSLAGGIGRVSGVMLGALFLNVVIDAVAKLIRAGSDDFKGMIVGLLVVLAVAFNQLTGAQGGWKKQFFPGWLGGITIFTIGLLAGGVLAFSLRMSGDGNAWWTGGISGCSVMVLLTGIRFASSVASRRAMSGRKQHTELN